MRGKKKKKDTSAVRGEVSVLPPVLPTIVTFRPEKQCVSPAKYFNSSVCVWGGEPTTMVRETVRQHPVY